MLGRLIDDNAACDGGRLGVVVLTMLRERVAICVFGIECWVVTSFCIVER